MILRWEGVCEVVADWNEVCASGTPRFPGRACMSRSQDVRLCVTTRGVRHCADNACASARVSCGALPVRDEDGVGACAAGLVE